MKRLSALFPTIFASLVAFSQQWTTSGNNIYNSNTGNVGIGTTNPVYPLQINSSATEIVSIIGNGSVRGGYYAQTANPAGMADLIIENDHGNFSSYAAFGYGGSANTQSTIFGLSRVDRPFLVADGTYNLGLSVGTLQAQPLVLGTNNLERMRVFAGGDVAIGTTSDNGNKLAVNGNLWATGLVVPTGAGAGKVLTSDASGNATWQTAGVSSGWVFGGNSVAGLSAIGTVSNFDLPFITNNTEQMRIPAGGGLAIGTTSTQGYLLAVNGSAIFTKATVKLFANWPDFVFRNDYDLPTLSSVEQYIRVNGHLQDIPSADSVAKSGLDLGANQTALLKKIEELTLYVINEDKTIREYQEKFAVQDQKTRALEEKIERLEKLIRR